MEFRKYANLLVRSDGRIFITKDIEYPYFYRFKRNGETDGYPCVRINGGKCVTCHQVVARTWLQPPPNKRFKFVDHISRVRSDFRPENLRYVTPWQNSINRFIHSAIQFDKEKKLWVAGISLKGTVVTLGSYKTYNQGVHHVMRAKEIIFDLVREWELKNVSTQELSPSLLNRITNALQKDEEGRETVHAS